MATAFEHALYNIHYMCVPLRLALRGEWTMEMYRRWLLQVEGDDITSVADVKTTGREYIAINPTLLSYCATNRQMRRVRRRKGGVGGDVPRSDRD